MRVAGLAGPPQVDCRTGLGPVLTVALAVGGAVVVDLGPPAVRGDDPGGGPPLLQGVGRLDALLDLLSRRHGSVRLREALLWKTGRDEASVTCTEVRTCSGSFPLITFFQRMSE